MESALKNVLVLDRVFNHIPLNDLVQYRLVSKLWRQSIDEHVSQKNELILFVNTRPHSYVWLRNNEKIDLNNVITVNEKFYLDCDLIKKFKNIRKLLVLKFEKFSCNRSFNSFLNSNFKRLKHLQINLLCFEQPSKEKLVISLNMDELETLCCNARIKYSDLNCKSLTHLSIYDDFQTSFIRSFSNLKYLNVRSLIGNDQLPSIESLGLEKLPRDLTVRNFPNLKEILIKDLSSHRLLAFESSLPQTQMQLYSDNLKYDKRFKTDFVSNINRLGNELLLYNKNKFNLNTNRSYLKRFDYSDLLVKEIKKIDKNLAKSFFNNFVACSIVEPNLKPENLNALSDYFSHIFYIEVSVQEDQKLFNSLPKFAPLLKHLVIRNNKKLGYNFLGEFKHLKFVECDDPKFVPQALKYLIKNCESAIKLKSLNNGGCFTVKIKKDKKLVYKTKKTRKVYNTVEDYLRDNDCITRFLKMLFFFI